MCVKQFLERAKEIEEQIKQDRQYLHQHAELGLDLPMTTSYVLKRLEEMGITGKSIAPSGIIADIGGKEAGKMILLRADMDALPMKEENDLSYKTVTDAAHTCGHDMHTAMLLGAAKLLKEKEAELCGTVRLLFQPGEETGDGAKAMINAGVLDCVDVAFGMHIMLDWKAPAFGYGSGYMTSSCEDFIVSIKGIGCHGAMPHMGIDPINVGFHIYSAYQALIAREVPPSETVSLTIGHFEAGTKANIIPEEAVLEGTLRTYNKEISVRLVERMKEIAKQCGEMFHAKVEYTTRLNLPPTYSDPVLTEELATYIDEMDPTLIKDRSYRVTPSEDFALIADKVPASYFLAGGKVENCQVQHHNPKVVFDEKILAYGSAVHATCAYRWLEAHKE